MPKDDMREIEIRLDAQLDQWLARIRTERESGAMDTSKNAMIMHLAKMCGVDMDATDTISTSVQPVLIFLAYAMSRLLADEKRQTPQLPEDPDPYAP